MGVLITELSSIQRSVIELVGVNCSTVTVNFALCADLSTSQNSLLFSMCNSQTCLYHIIIIARNLLEKIHNSLQNNHFVVLVLQFSYLACCNAMRVYMYIQT